MSLKVVESGVIRAVVLNVYHPEVGKNFTSIPTTLVSRMYTGVCISMTVVVFSLTMRESLESQRFHIRFYLHETLMRP